MTDSEYNALLVALAGKHLTPERRRKRSEHASDVRGLFDELSSVVAKWRSAQASEDANVIGELTNLPGNSLSPICRALECMERAGIVDALDDAHDLIFSHFRPCAIPKEELDLLRNAGFSRDEIAVLVSVAVDKAHALAEAGETAWDVIAAACGTVATGVGTIDKNLLQSVGDVDPTHAKTEPRTDPSNVGRWRPQRRLDEIGKVVAGAIGAVGSVLLLTRPAVGADAALASLAIGSGSFALASVHAGLSCLCRK